MLQAIRVAIHEAISAPIRQATSGATPQATSVPVPRATPQGAIGVPFREKGHLFHGKAVHLLSLKHFSPSPSGEKLILMLRVDSSRNELTTKTTENTEMAPRGRRGGAGESCSGQVVY
jgi:hypothetical protein